ncbi:14167_t:CDS:2, partial [Gigaspora rosea]
IDSRLESGYYLSFLEYFKNEHREESEFLIKQYKIKVWWDVISGNDVEELQLVLDTALNLKNNYCQIECLKASKDLDCLSEKLSFTINHLNDSYVKGYIDDILAWYTYLNTVPLRINSKIPEISPDCSFEEKIQFGEVSGPPSKNLPNKERFDLGRNNHNAKDEKSLCKLTIVAEFGPILDESDLNTLLNELYVFMIQKKTIETSVLDHMMNKIYRTIPLERKNIDKVGFLQFLFTIYELILQKKLVLSQTITTSTLSSSPSSDNFTGTPKESIINLLDFFLTPARAKETLREMNPLFPNEQVFVIDNTIILTSKRMPLSTIDDDLIPEFKFKNIVSL